MRTFLCYTILINRFSFSFNTNRIEAPIEMFRDKISRGLIESSRIVIKDERRTSTFTDRINVSEICRSLLLPSCTNIARCNIAHVIFIERVTVKVFHLDTRFTIILRAYGNTYRLPKMLLSYQLLSKKKTRSYTAYHSRLILSILINDENGAIHLA